MMQKAPALMPGMDSTAMSFFCLTAFLNLELKLRAEYARLACQVNCEAIGQQQEPTERAA
jgi:hypothetical protein